MATVLVCDDSPLARETIRRTVAEDHEGVARAVASGARGYIVKDISRDELAATVTQALADVARRTDVVAERTFTPPPGRAPQLTERERQVLEGMASGKSNGEIGRQLYLSEDTVKTHARRLFRKLGAADRAQAVALGFRWGLVR